MLERFDTGELAALVARTEGGGGFRRQSADALARAAGIVAVTQVENGTREALLGPGAPVEGRQVDLERLTLGGSITGAFAALSAPADARLVLVGRPRSNASLTLEVAVEMAPLREGLWRETGRVLAASLALALLIGALIYAALADGFVRPMRRLTDAIARFRARPHDASERLVPSGRPDEIGAAEAAFADMQEALRQALLQRERLAALGVAVSKISHDLRHSLATAQLVSERLASVDDPAVRTAAPRLERALERAAALAESTLRFGRADERAPDPVSIGLRDLLDEVAGDALAVPGHGEIVWRNEVPASLRVVLDGEHGFRLFSNLMRNAAQAMASARPTGNNTGQPPVLSAHVREAGERVVVSIADMGPGLPDKVRARLFEPFSASGVSGGTGLGLAIARDLARLNGGDLVLAASGPAGTRFEASLRIASPDTARSQT
jgi:signal transduction histidine kinase